MYREENPIPYYKPGGKKVFFDPDEVEKWFRGEIGADAG
jgi:hypothetical protein